MHRLSRRKEVSFGQRAFRAGYFTTRCANTAFVDWIGKLTFVGKLALRQRSGHLVQELFESRNRRRYLLQGIGRRLFVQVSYLLLQVSFYEEAGPLFGPVFVADAAQELGALVEEAVVRG